MKKLFYLVSLIVVCLFSLPTMALAEKLDRPIKLWPVFLYEQEEGRGEADLIWPIFRYEREGSRERYAIRPFIFSTAFDPKTDYRETSFIWPLNVYKREGLKTRLHVFPIYWYKNTPSEHYKIFFPVYWDGDDGSHSYFHLWPLFGVNRRGESYREYSTLYPFFRYGRDDGGETLDLHFLWPLINYHRESTLLSHRFLPFYWVERGDDQSGGFIFPYFWREAPSEASRGIFPIWFRSEGNETRTDLVFPFYFDRKRPDDHTRMITPLYYSRTQPEERTQVLFPLWYRRQEPDEHTNLILPLYLDRKTEKEHLRAIAPLYFSRETDEGHFKSVLPLYFDYLKNDLRFQVGLPLFYRYRNEAFTLSTFFPFYFHSEDKALDSSFDYYFPLYGRYRRGETVDNRFFLFPMYARYEDEERQLKGLDVLWPLFHYETSPRASSLRVLPFYWQAKTEDYRFRLLLPLYADYAAGDKSFSHYFAFIFPVYGEHREGLVYRKRFFFGPLYIHTKDTRTDLVQHDVLFSIFSRKKEGDQERTWLLPLYYHEENPERAFSAGFVPLPYFNYRSEGHAELHYWPLYSRRQVGDYRESGVLWPLIRFGHDEKSDLRVSQFLLYYRQKEADRAFTTVFPLWMRQTEAAKTTDASLFLHWYQADREKDAAQLSLLWLIPPTPAFASGFQLPQISLFRYEGGPHKKTHAFFPLYTYASDDGKDSLKWSFLWPLFSYHSDAELVTQTGFLWKVITYEKKHGDETEFRFLWRFIRRSKTPTRSIFEFNPLFSYDYEKGRGSYWDILGGLIGRETTEDGQSKTRWFWLF